MAQNVLNFTQKAVINSFTSQGIQASKIKDMWFYFVNLQLICIMVQNHLKSYLSKYPLTIKIN